MSDEGAQSSETDSEKAAVLSALVTEHFVLQSAAGATISESGSRASIYLAALSSGLVAIGFSSQSPSTLVILASTVFPTVYALGWFTVVRLVDTGIAAVVAQRRIEAIRAFYAQLSSTAAGFFPPDDERAGTLGVRYGARSVLFTTATMIGVVNSVLGGSAGAVVLSVAVHAGPAVAVPAGLVIGISSLVAAIAYQERRFSRARSVGQVKSLF